jgi:HlyD family secretion protein
MFKQTIIGLVIVAALAAGGWYWFSGTAHSAPFRTVQVERGSLTATINATGTIEPEEVVDIGAQVAGQIVSFGADPYDPKKVIDFGTPVEKNTVLARIDAALYQAAVDRAQAQLELANAGVDSANAQVAVAEANLARAKADLLQMTAKLDQATNDFKRTDRLVQEGSAPRSDYDAFKAAYLTGHSTVNVGKAMIVQAEASLADAKVAVKKAVATQKDAQAALNNAQINLGYCVIKSPVKGVIVDRRVNIGQTVVSSLNAPSLFLIAKDLKRLQVWASVNEADIGQVFPGQKVTFTVDAHADRTFKGTVLQTRLNASMTQNVVTYTVVVETDNSDGKLLPYLTANIQFEVNKRENVLLVPNSALRYKPSTAESVVPDARADYLKKQQQRTKAAPGETTPPAGDAKSADAKKENRDRAILWVAEGDFVRPVKVQIGLTDGVNTEIVKGDIQDGAVVVSGENHGTATAGTNNPFAPKMFGGSGKKE